MWQDFNVTTFVSVEAEAKFNAMTNQTILKGQQVVFTKLHEDGFPLIT